MPEPNDNDSSPAVSGSELNNGGLSSAATSPTPSEPMSQPFTPPTSSHVGSTHTPPTHLQNVDSGLMNKSHDGSGRISACATNIQESLKHNFELNGTDVPLDDFLLFLLATVLPRETHDIQQLGTAWKKILRAAVELCNENQDIPISPENERSFTDATSEAHMNTLQQLLLAYRNADGSETARYAHWVRLSNHVLEKLLGPNVANCLTDIGLPQLTIDESTLIFQCNGGKQSTDGDFNVDSRLVAEGTSRSPQATGLSIAAALKTTRRSSPESGVSWKTTWRNHCTNVASTISQTAAEWSDILLNVEFRKQKGYEMQPIPSRYDERSQVGDIKPYSLNSSSTNDSELEKGTSDNEDDSEDAITGSEDEDDTSDNEDDISDDEDATSDDEDATSEDELELEPLASTNQNKKRSRKPDNSSAERSKKKRTGNNGKVVCPGPGDENYGSRSRPPKAVSRPPPPEQMAINAAERLSSSVAVRHSISLLVIGDRLWLWWSDRGGAIQSHSLNFIANLPHFVALLAILQRFTPENWGQDIIFGSGSRSQVKLRGPPEERSGLRPEVEIKVAVDKSQLAINLFSRASCVVLAECDTDFRQYGVTDSEYVAKIYYPDETRSNEAQNLAKAYEIAAGENGGDVRGHLPILLAEQTWRDNSADLIDKILHVRRRGSKRRKRYRVLRILLFTKLHPISKLSGLDFIKALRSSFLCHGALWMKGLHHRDISEGNLMWTMINGEISGVVNDFDLAIIFVESETHEPEGERTGTRIFMASELVENLDNSNGIAHIYDFDVESFAYVALWITGRYDKGSPVISTPLKLLPKSNWTPYTDWIKNSDRPASLSALKLVDLCRCWYYWPSHISFQGVYTRFFRAVVSHVFEARDRKFLSQELATPNAVFSTFKCSIDEPLEQLGQLTEVNRTQQRIQIISPVKQYEMLARWGLIEWDREIDCV